MLSYKDVTTRFNSILFLIIIMKTGFKTMIIVSILTGIFGLSYLVNVIGDFASITPNINAGIIQGVVLAIIIIIWFYAYSKYKKNKLFN
jgi:hypothetical protein